MRLKQLVLIFASRSAVAHVNAGKFNGARHIFTNETQRVPRRRSKPGYRFDRVTGRFTYQAGSNTLTVLAWVEAATNATGEIVAKWSTNAVAGSYVLSLSNGVPELELMLDGSYTTVAGTTGLADTNWHQVAGVYDGETMKVYLDTNLVASASASGAVGRSRTNSQYLASAPAGHVRVWTNAQRTATGPVLDNGTGTSISWALSNMPAILYLEGVSPSTETNDLKVVLQYQNCLAVTTKVTVVDVASVSWVEKPISPLTNNFDLGGIGGGKAIFPDRPSPTAAPDDYQVVKVIAVIKPPMPDITIYFTSIDVDDPSTNAAPVDHELVTQDNRGDPKTGSFIGGGWSSTFAWGTEPGGTSTVTFITTRQPADNFRVIASPLADFKNGYEAQQNTNNGAIVTKYGVSKTAIPPNYTTEMPRQT